MRILLALAIGLSTAVVADTALADGYYRAQTLTSVKYEVYKFRKTVQRYTRLS